MDLDSHSWFSCQRWLALNVITWNSQLFILNMFSFLDCESDRQRWFTVLKLLFYRIVYILYLFIENKSKIFSKRSKLAQIQAKYFIYIVVNINRLQNLPITHESKRHFLISLADPSSSVLDAQWTSSGSSSFRLVHWWCIEPLCINGNWQYVPYSEVAHFHTSGFSSIREI